MVNTVNNTVFPFPLTLPLFPERSEGWFDDLHALSVVWWRESGVEGSVEEGTGMKQNWEQKDPSGAQ